MRWLVGLGAFTGLALAAGMCAVYLGLPNVAATAPHWSTTEWLLGTAMERSVRRRAGSIAAPADLDDPARIRAGAAAYDDMCAGCHAAPGREADALAAGLLPQPPKLAEEVAEWSAAELFWIAKHGIRMTGMPASGPTHSDSELWHIVAFLLRLPDLSPAAYRALIEAAGEGHVHEHGSGDRAEPGHSH